MGVNIGKIASVASKVSTLVSVGSLLSGIDIKNLSADNISGVKGIIENKLKEVSNSVTGEITSAVTENDIQSMVGNIDIESKVKSMIESTGLDSSGIDTAQIDSMVNELMNLSSINFM